MKSKLFISLSLIAVIFSACKRDLIAPKLGDYFIKYYGETGDDVAYDLEVSDEGDFFFVGYTTTENGDKDAYIVKSNKFGYIEWSKNVGGELDDEFRELILAGDGIYVVGTTEDSIYGKDIMLNVFNYDGEIIGERVYNSFDNQEGNSIGISGQSIILAGSSTRANNVGLGSPTGTNAKGVKDLFVLKVENSNDDEINSYPVEDQFQAGNSNDDEINSIAISNGNILASGILNYTDQNDEIDNDNATIINLLVNTLDVPPYDGYGSELNDVCNKVIFDRDGKLVMVGSTKNSTDPFILRISDITRLGENDEDLIKNFDFNTADNEILFDIFQTEDGGYIIAGSTDGEGNGGIDILLLKIANDGKEEWHKTYGGAGDDVGYAVEQTSDGGYIVLATTKLGVGDDLTDQEIMLLKVTSEGELK